MLVWPEAAAHCLLRAHRSARPVVVRESLRSGPKRDELDSRVMGTRGEGAQFVIGFGVIRTELKRSLQMPNGLFTLPVKRLCRAQVEMVFCGVWFEPQRFLKMKDCLIQATGLI